MQDKNKTKLGVLYKFCVCKTGFDNQEQQSRKNNIIIYQGIADDL